MNLAQTNLDLGSASVPLALVDVSSASRTALRETQRNLLADAAIVRRGPRNNLINFPVAGAVGFGYD